MTCFSSCSNILNPFSSHISRLLPSFPTTYYLLPTSFFLFLLLASSLYLTVLIIFLHEYFSLHSLSVFCVSSFMHFLPSSLSPLQLSLPSVIFFRARVLVPIDLRTIASETKMSFYGTDHALFAKVIILYHIILYHIILYHII